MPRFMGRFVVPVDDKPHGIVLTIGNDPTRAETVVNNIAMVEFWAEMNTSHAARVRHFQVFGTGQPLPHDAQYIATCPRHPSSVVWHLYEVFPDTTKDD